ncbi:BTAD domain-containing putative transcriptional regulator [Streptomyces sp. NPDC005805]|uniref:BTAD domain-containing putative transcriptional regulator n=1 Tax=Streptomyces sp. NPDC005805 TaxID=3157068 RepID=UPI0033D2327E
MLGPLEVVSGGRSIELGGSKQRAALGFLLLQPNQVVPTSQLLRALWSLEEAPATARKILQNAVWGLRRRLAAADDTQAPVTLRTQAPGYALDVAPEQVDLHLFSRRVEQGRIHLAAGASEEAARQLRDALKLWRGSVLADLVEVGFMWPELTTVQNTRLDVLEDCFEAELACGRHYAVLGELEALVEAEPLRERSCGQLMRALYRCGRQADALGVYSRLRSSLVEDLGLEPSRELQLLQQAILMQDPALQYAPPAALVTMPVPRGPADPSRASAPDGLPFPLPDGRTPAAPPATAADSEPRPAPKTALPVPVAATAPVRQEVSVVLVRTGLSPDTPEGTDTDAALDRAGTRIRQEIESRGGTVAAAMGADTLGLFPAQAPASDHAERALQAAGALRTAFACTAEPGTGGAPMPGEVVLRTAIVTGEALVRRGGEHGTAPLSASGALLHACQAMLPLVPDGEIQVCPDTREAAGPGYSFTQPAGSPLRWQLRHVATETGVFGYSGLDSESDYGGELDLLHSLMVHTGRWSRSHLVSVLGSSGAARTQMLMDFRQLADENPRSAQVVFWCGPPAPRAGAFVAHRSILSAYCGISGQDSAQTARAKLEAVLHRLVGEQGRANWLAARLGPFVDPAVRPEEGFGTGEWLDSWYQFLETASKERPLVLIVDDMHRADDALLDFVESLAAPGRQVLALVVAGAAPDFLSRRPALTNSHYTTVITMDEQAGGTVSRLLDSLALPADLSLARAPWDAPRA